MRQAAICSVIIITKNEAEHLPHCLAAVPHGWDIIVVDSFSSDATVAIAEKHGCRVFLREFKDYADQKNFALGQVYTPWALAIDADERVANLEDLESFLKDTDAAGFALRRELVFMQRRLRYGKTTDYPIRLFKKSAAQYEGAIHEVCRVEGKVERCDLFVITHYSYRNIQDYFERFNRYTSLIAKGHYERGKRVSLLLLAIRPFSEFLMRYFLRLGFLDGFPGYAYALISSLYAFVKYLKLYELEHGSP